MSAISITFKKISTLILYFFLAAWCLVRYRRYPAEIREVAVLFLPILGIGDLVMLSPAIAELAKVFPGARVTLITHIPEIIQFEGVTVVRPELAAPRFDLVISPTLNLRHLPYVFRSRYFAGYFARPRAQANFPLRSAAYSPAGEHYLHRAIALLTSFNEQRGKRLAAAAAGRLVLYPPIITKEPPQIFTELKTKKYILAGIFSKITDRRWPADYFVSLFRHLLADGYGDSLVLIGDSSPHNRAAAASLVPALGLPAGTLIDATGKFSLSETAYLIRHSHLFIGLDSGPSHLAYVLAPRSAVIFVTVPPADRLPLSRAAGKIAALYPDPPPQKPLYTGWGRTNAAEAARLAATITEARVISEIKNLF